jgi:hypothetical protein
MLCGCDGGASGDQRWIHLCPLHTAAPDLLVALEQIAAIPLDEDVWWDNRHPLIAPEATVIARVAIAKTKGEA